MRQKLLSPLLRSGACSSNLLPRFFSTNKGDPSWRHMSYQDKVSWAVNSVPNTADEAYYKGLGLLTAGSTLLEEVVASLEQAIEISRGNHWLANVKLAEIYNSMGKHDKAYDVIAAAINHLHHTIKLNGSSLNEIRDVIRNSEPNNSYIPTSAHGKEHNEENLWFSSWKLSQIYVKLGQKDRAFDLLISAKDYLEYAVRIDSSAFDYLRDLLLTEMGDKEDLHFQSAVYNLT